MTTIIERFEEIAGQYDAVFCDVWGCVHDGVEPIASACAALARYALSGGKIVLITNSPRASEAVERQIDLIGVPRDAWHAITTSGDAARYALFRGDVGRAVYHIGPGSGLEFFKPLRSRTEFAEPIKLVSLNEAEGIVCTGLVDDENESPEDYADLLQVAADRDLKFLCANPDVIVDRGDKRVFCAGALSQLYAELGGTTLLFGKPRRTIYDLAREQLSEISPGIADPRIICIGDGITTDIEGAAARGLDSLFVSGGLARHETGTRFQPNPALLTEFLTKSGLDPTYTIGQLR